MGYIIEQIVSCENHLGESPVWDVEESCLYWLDSTGRRAGKPAVWRLDPGSGKTKSWTLERDVGAMALRKRGGAILALEDGFYVFDFKSGALDLIVKVPDAQPRMRLNDGKCDRAGRFIAGGMDDQEELPICSIWRLDPDLSLSKLIGDVICTNGPCWSPDNRTFYVADTFREEIWAYDYDLVEGSIANRRVFASSRQEEGLYDGSTIDSEGCLWNACVIAGELLRYAPDGRIDLRICLPVRLITSVMFGGEKLDEIYVTSMARVAHPKSHQHYRSEAKPQFSAGSLFRIRGLGITGLPETRFGG